MNSSVAQAYRTNRGRYRAAELRPYNGKWVAFSADGRSVVASASSLIETSNQVVAAGKDPGDVVFERIELDGEDTND